MSNNKITGKVGAFWLLSDYSVIGEACLLHEAEQDEKFYNGLAAHNDLWPRLMKPVSLLGQTYTTVPRGRVIYNKFSACFVIFAAPEILADQQAKDAIEDFYQLGKEGDCIVWRDDPHYETQPDLIDELDDYSNYS